MRTFGANIDAALDDPQGTQDLLLLVRVGSVRRALHARSFTDPAGDVWTADRGDFGIIEETQEQKVPRVELALQNVDKGWLPLLADLNESEVDLLIAHRPSGETAVVTTLYVSGHAATRESLRVNLGDKFSHLAMRTVQPTVASLVEDEDGNEVKL